MTINYKIVQRVNLELGQKSMEQLDELQKLMYTPSKAETIRRAIEITLQRFKKEKND